MLNSGAILCAVAAMTVLACNHNARSPGAASKITTSEKESSVTQATTDPVDTSNVDAILASASAELLGWSRSKPSRALAAIEDVAPILHRIAGDSNRSDGDRYKAFEAMGGLKLNIPDNQRKAAAELYVAALKQALEHDEYGLPDAAPTGPGARVVALGTAAAPALATLLGDTRPLLYEGSEEPTISEMRGYRVKDLAGRYLALILGQPFDVEEDDASKRDAELSALQKAAR